MYLCSALKSGYGHIISRICHIIGIFDMCFWSLCVAHRSKDVCKQSLQQCSKMNIVHIMGSSSRVCGLLGQLLLTHCYQNWAFKKRGLKLSLLDATLLSEKSYAFAFVFVRYWDGNCTAEDCCCSSTAFAITNSWIRTCIPLSILFSKSSHAAAFIWSP